MLKKVVHCNIHSPITTQNAHSTWSEASRDQEGKNARNHVLQRSRKILFYWTVGCGSFPSLHFTSAFLGIGAIYDT